MRRAPFLILLSGLLISALLTGDYLKLMVCRRDLLEESRRIDEALREGRSPLAVLGSGSSYVCLDGCAYVRETIVTYELSKRVSFILTFGPVPVEVTVSVYLSDFYFHDRRS